MLNKDEYNQEEYNDYYRQETEGSELGGGGSPEPKPKKRNKLIILLLLLLLVAVGYF